MNRDKLKQALTVLKDLRTKMSGEAGSELDGIIADLTVLCAPAGKGYNRAQLRLLARTYKRDRKGRFAKTDSAGMVKELDDIMSRLDELSKLMGEDERDAIGNAKEYLAEARKSRQDIADAGGEEYFDLETTNYHSVQVSSSSDGEISLDWDDNGMLLTADEAEETAGFLDEFGGMTTEPLALATRTIAERTTSSGNVKAVLWNNGVVEVGEASSTPDNTDDQKHNNFYIDMSDDESAELENVADALEKTAEHTRVNAPQNHQRAPIRVASRPYSAHGGRGRKLMPRQNQQLRPAAKTVTAVSERGWFRILNAAADTAQVFLYNEIGGDGITLAGFRQDLAQVTAPNLEVRVNSPGGDVFDGIGIHNALANHPARVHVVVDGLAASIASVIAIAGARVTMAPGSQMMIHEGYTAAVGNAEHMIEQAKLLNKVSDNIATFYVAKAGGTVGDWRARMRAETWYSADEAVAAGLADEVAARPIRNQIQVGVLNAFDLTVFRYAGRTNAPAPALQTQPAMAVTPPREDLWTQITGPLLTPSTRDDAIFAALVEAL